MSQEENTVKRETSTDEAINEYLIKVTKKGMREEWNKGTKEERRE